jgi:tetratricopeptide (TPR) repeat protein
MRVGECATLLFVLAAIPAVVGGQEPTSDATVRAARVEGTALERQGAYAEAAEAFRRGLRVEPANAILLMGLERTLSRVGRVAEALPAVERAVALEPTNELVRDLEFRIGVRLGGADSAAAIAARWIAALPESESPYREWSRWLAQRGETDAALAVLRQAQARFGDAVLAEYAAPVLAQADAWVESAAYWTTALAQRPGLLSPAASNLGRAPENVRASVLAELLNGPGPEGHWLAADLLVMWGRATEGWTVLATALPGDTVEATRVVTRFADRARTMGTDDANLARGYALERLAQMSVGANADRARLQAAQAFADAANLTAAQRMLSQISVGRDAKDPEAVAAMTTFVRVLAESGRIEEAARLFAEWKDRLPVSTQPELREHLAWGWVDAGELDRAQDLVGTDSTVGAFAVQGWLALYRGDLRVASERLRAAGPFAQSRKLTTRSAEMLALLQRIETDQLPALGQALLSAARGDTAAAVGHLVRAADALPARSGRADVLALAGRWARESAAHDRAEPLLLEAFSSDPTGPAGPSAELELALLYEATGRPTEALDRVEHLILTYPESAVVPQARRLLDRIRGTVPKT